MPVSQANLALAAEYIRHHHFKRCCCRTSVEQDDCKRFRPHTQICCLKVTVPTWSHHAIVRRTDWAPGDACDYRTDQGIAQPNTNLCGLLGTVGWGDCLPPVVVSWTVAADGLSVNFFVTVNQYEAGEVPTTWTSTGHSRLWFLSSFTLTNGLGRTVTIEDCPVPTVEWSPPRPPVMLHGKAYFAPAGGPHEGDFTSAQFANGEILTFSPAKSYFARGEGDPICGVFKACAEDISLDRLAIDWQYQIWDDTVLIRVRNSVNSTYFAEMTIPYVADWQNSIDGELITIDMSLASFVPARLNGWIPVAGYVKIFLSEGCDDPYPGDCEPYECFPLCVANVCPEAPTVVNAITIFLSIDGLEAGQFLWNVAAGHYVLDDGSGGLSPAWTGTIQCVGGVPTLYLEDTSGNNETWPLTMTCSGGTMNDIELIWEALSPGNVPVTLTA